MPRDKDYWKSYNSSPARKAKKAEQDRKRHSTPESRRKQSEYLKEYTASDEYKAKEAARGERRRADPAEIVKRRARDLVHKAVKSGRLVRQPCQECGDLESQAHHADYSKPLDVEWLCQKCHISTRHIKECADVV